MFHKNGRHFHDSPAASCPYHSLARSRFGCRRRTWLHASAMSALAAPATYPQPNELVVASSVSPSPAVQRILLANGYTHIKEVFATHRATMAPADFALAWVRLAKISKDPVQRLSPELQKFVDILACATIDRMSHFSPAHLCSVIWAASKLKKDVAQSGMFKSFLKSWAAEIEPHLECLDLDKLRKCMAAVTRVSFNPGPSWTMKVEVALTRRLGAFSGGGANDAKTLACCLVSAASLGFAQRPSLEFREAIAAACGAAFAPGRGGIAAAAGSARGGGSAARCAASALWAAAVLGVPLSHATVQAMLVQVTAVAGSGGDGATGASSSSLPQWRMEPAAAVPPAGGGTGVPMSRTDAGFESATTSPASLSSSYTSPSVSRVGSTAAAALSSSSSSGSGDFGSDRGRVRSSSSLSSSLSSSSPPTGEVALTPLDFAQVFWALSKLRYSPGEPELSRLLTASAQLLPSAPPELLATVLWGLADLELVPPASWLQLTYSSFERQLDAASAEPLQALLHAAATLQLPAPQWSDKLMERLQDVDLQVLPDGNVVDLVMSMHALAMHPPPQLAHRLQDECLKRLASRRGAAAAGPEATARTSAAAGAPPMEGRATSGASSSSAGGGGGSVVAVA